MEQLVRLCGVQDKWDVVLPQLVSAYHDTSCRSLDGATPFEVVYGFRRRDGVEVAWGRPSDSEPTIGRYVSDRVEAARKIHAALLRRHRERHLADAARIDPRHHTGLQLKVGDRCVVLRHGFHKTSGQRYFGPVRITEDCGHDNWRVAPIQAGMHDIFHVSKLKLFPERGEGDPNPPTTSLSPDNEKYVVEQFIGKKGKGLDEMIKVLWAGWPRSQASYVFRSSLVADGFERELEEFDQWWKSHGEKSLRGGDGVSFTTPQQPQSDPPTAEKEGANPTAELDAMARSERRERRARDRASAGSDQKEHGPEVQRNGGGETTVPTQATIDRADRKDRRAQDREQRSATQGQH